MLPSLPTHCGSNQNRETKKYYCDCGNEMGRQANHCMDCYNQKRKIIKDHPSHTQLLADLQVTNYAQTGKKYNVSDNTIRKWLRAYEAEQQSKENNI